MSRVVLGIAASTLIAGCAAQPVAHPAAATTAGATSISGSSPVSAERICRDVFPKAKVLGWRLAGVGDLRAYQYGGPVAHFPLQSAFVGVSAAQQGAWCWLGDGSETGSLWGAVLGSVPQRAITVTGPGEGQVGGEMQYVPLVP